MVQGNTRCPAIASIIRHFVYESKWYAWQDSNLRPSVPETDALVQLSYRRTYKINILRPIIPVHHTLHQHSSCRAINRLHCTKVSMLREFMASTSNALPRYEKDYRRTLWHPTDQFLSPVGTKQNTLSNGDIGLIIHC